MSKEKIFMPTVEGIFPNITSARLAMARRTGKVSPVQGGCWFCWEKDDKLVFDSEFDTAVHVKCIRKVLAVEPNHPEANIMKYLLETPKSGG